MSPLQKTFSSFMIRGLRVLGRIPLIGDAIVRASFDAVRQNWGDRSWMFQTLQDAWQEIDKCTRYELQRIHGGLVENCYLTQKIRALFLQFSVGASGLICTPNASRFTNRTGTAAQKEVEAWNHLKGENWAKWFRAPELNSNISGGQLTRLWSGLLFDTGEIFVNLVTFADCGRAGKCPKFQTIDSHRCETPGDKRENNGNVILDGVEIDAAGKPVAYWIKRTNFEVLLTSGYGGTQLYDRIQAYDPANWRKGGIIHKYKHRRPGQYRGIPEGFAVYNLTRDHLDLHKLEMQAAKLASDIANVETNSMGELNALTNRRSRMGIGTTTDAGQITTKTIPADYKVSVGAKNIALQKGDALNQFMITRPTIVTQEYWDLHCTTICLGYNIPKMLVMPYSLQGTVTRADLDISSYGFGQENYEIIAELLTEGYEWQSAWAKDYDRSLDGEWPEDFAAVFIRPPRKPNVDIGYTAKAEDMQLRNGTKTLPDVYAEKQMDFRVKLREIAEAAKYVDDLATEFGIDASRITSLAVSEAMMADQKSDPVEGAHGGGKGGDANALSKQVIHA